MEKGVGNVHAFCFGDRGQTCDYAILVLGCSYGTQIKDRA